jgi:hypothetical protein
MRHVDRPEPNCTPEAAMELLLEKARLVFGDQDWSAWTWEAREFGTGTRTPETVLFLFEGGPSSGGHLHGPSPGAPP